MDELTNTNTEASFKLLLRNWNADRALRMIDILLDDDTPPREMAEAFKYLSDLLADPETQTRLKNNTFAIPLPSKKTLQSIVDLTDSSAKPARDFISELFSAQKSVAAVRAAWEAIPDVRFGSRPDRTKFEAAAVAAGA